MRSNSIPCCIRLPNGTPSAHIQAACWHHANGPKLTALAGAEPLIQAQAAPVQQLQFFLSESSWDAAAIAMRTLELLCADPLIAPTADGVLVIDDTGDRKDGCATDHVARQYLGSVGKIDNGIVAVITLWAHEQRYYPLHVMPYTPEGRLASGKQDPAFRTKPQIALALIEHAQAIDIAFEAIVADSAYGDNPLLCCAFAFCWWHEAAEVRLQCSHCGASCALHRIPLRPPKCTHLFLDGP